MSLLDLPLDERPRERLAQLGASALSSRELVATLLGTGARGLSALDLAGELLGPGLHSLAARSVRELEQVRGLGRAKAVPLLEVRWPVAGGAVQTFRDLPLNHVVEVREGDPAHRARRLQPRPRPAAGRSSHPHP